MKTINKQLFAVLFIILLVTSTVYGQMERKQVQTDGPVQDVFWAPTLITQASTAHLPAGNLNSTIMHSFGVATQRPLQTFFGIDNVRNVRLGVDYGITDRWSMGIGRSSLTNIVDLRTKLAILRQNQSDTQPVSISVKGDLGIVTQENERPIKDDVSTLVSAIFSRKFNDHLSLQVTPMYGHISSVSVGDPHSFFAVGLGAHIPLSRRFALSAEYYPVISKRADNTKNTFSLGLNIETGGHVFQLFFTSTEWHLEQYVLATNREQFWAGDFRFGFNVNRVFSIVK